MVVHTVRWRRAILAAASRRLLAIALVLAAIANLAAALIAHPQAQAIFISNVVDLNLLGWGRDGAIVAGTLLLLVSHALARGKRQAWLLAVGLLTFLLLSAQADHHGIRYLTIELVALIILVALAPLFPTRSDPRALRRGYAAIALSIASFTAIKIVERVWDPEVGPFTDSLRSLLLLAIRAALFLFLTYGLIEVLRPVIGVRRPQHWERGRALALIHTYGDSATAHFTTAADMSYFWSASGHSFIAYRLVRGVALALGDPVGPAWDHPALLTDFVAYCRRQDWVFAAYLASSTFRELCAQASLHAYKVGEEAVIDVAQFSTAGKAGAPVRHAMTRARRDGVSVRIWQGEPIPAEIFAGMQDVSQAWLAGHGNATQMGFSMGRFPADWTSDLLSVVACDAAGRVCAFLTWTPLFDGHGWSLDAMRRTEQTAPGVMELLISEAVEWARARGDERMSLGLAPLAGLERDDASSGTCDHARGQQNKRDVQDDSRDTRERRAELAALTRLERGAGYLHRRRLLLGDYASLYHFKAKFRPAWEARYLISSDRATLPQVLSALMHAQGYRWWQVVRDAVGALHR